MFGLFSYQLQKKKMIEREAALSKEISIKESQRKISEEKLRISRELHDNIGSQLTFIISSLENINYNAKDGETKDQVNETVAFARTTLNELRNTVWALKHESGTLSTLIIKIQDFLNRTKSSTGKIKISIKNETQKDYNLNNIQLLNLFRIFQECLQNVFKHSAATECEIIFKDTENGFTMQICDNGTGINLPDIIESSGFDSLRFRTKEANGEFFENELKNDNGGGTKLIFKFNASYEN
jgi:signal transduction histidine kinase